MAVVALAATAVGMAPARAQTTTGEFSYSPEEQQRGQSITITGKCVNGGSTDNVDMIVTVQEGSTGEGSYGFSKAFLPTESGSISGTIEVPSDAPFGPYVIGAACRAGQAPPFFSKNGPFAVVERGGGVTTTSTSTTVEGATTTSSPTSTTSTTLADGETTTTSIEITFGERDSNDTTETTIDEFAGTRNEDDDSIAPLLLVLGAVPLLAAIVAVVLAMRRRATPDPDA